MLASGAGASVICVNPQSADTRAEVVAAVKAALDLGVAPPLSTPWPTPSASSTAGLGTLSVGTPTRPVVASTKSTKLPPGSRAHWSTSSLARRGRNGSARPL